MTNLARQPAYFENPSVTDAPIVKTRVIAAHSDRSRDTARKKKARGLSREDQQIVAELNTVRREMEFLHNRYDQITDPLLVDSLIYELKAANVKYTYYLQLCKEKGIVNG